MDELYQMPVRTQCIHTLSGPNRLYNWLQGRGEPVRRSIAQSYGLCGDRESTFTFTENKGQIMVTWGGGVLERTILFSCFYPNTEDQNETLHWLELSLFFNETFLQINMWVLFHQTGKTESDLVFFLEWKKKPLSSWLLPEMTMWSWETFWEMEETWWLVSAAMVNDCGSSSGEIGSCFTRLSLIRDCLVM